MRKFGLIGYPLSHSFSQQYFTDKFRLEGIKDCQYENFSIPSIDDFKRIITQNPDLEGLNVTIPYKQLIIPLLDHYRHTLALPACNCIKVRQGQTTGYNTDVTGFEKSLSSHIQPRHQTALILGNGGSAQAVQYVLRKLGIYFKIVSRKRAQGAELIYEDLGEQIINEYLLIINTTPIGMYPNTTACPPIPYQYLSSSHLLFDLIYNPRKSLFLQRGEDRGAQIVNGWDMLHFQAEESWRIWNS
jgi:shikimate dehydrogenase